MNRGIVATVVVILALLIYVFLIPPTSYDRTKPVPPQAVRIDNDFYDDPDIAKTWRDPKGLFSGLHKFNKIRVDYFEKKMNENEILVKARQIKTNRETNQVNKHKQEKMLYVDVGCGGGLATEELGIRGFSVVGVDLSKNSIQDAKRHLTETEKNLNKKIDVQYMVGSAFNLPFPNNSVDGVVMSDVLEHLEDLPSFMQELNRVIKPGGIFVFDTINRNIVSYWLAIQFVQYFFTIPPHAHDWRLFVTPEEMRELLTTHGFEYKEVAGVFPSINIISLLKGNGFMDSMTYSLLPSRTEVQYIGYATKRY